MNIERNRDHHTIDIDHHRDIRTNLAMFPVDQSRPGATPMAMKFQKRNPEEEGCDPTLYQSMTGRLMYGMTATRPDIA